VLGQVVELSGPASLKAIYKPGGGNVRGTVEKGAGVTVFLMTDETPASRLGFSARCDADGAFSIPDIPPGEYTAAAFPDIEALGSPDFQSLLAASGTRVRVDAGSAAVVELRVNK
jgi:hypothetical protein